MQYKTILSPGKIGPMELRNRIIQSSMGVNLCEYDGTPTEELIAYTERRAVGEVGLVQIGSVTVAHPEAVGAPRQAAFAKDEQIPVYAELAKRVHAHGAKLSLQLQHPGLVSGVSAFGGHAMLAPSIPDEAQSDMGLYHELSAAQRQMLLGEGSDPMPAPEIKVCTKEDIDWVIGKFVDAAKRAVEANVDAVEIHAGHGYLIHSFLNPRYNKRTDEYGGTAENRARLLCEVIAAIKRACGDKLAVMCKIDSVELLTDFGITNEDAVITARAAEAAGADAICCSAYAPGEKVICPTASHICYERNVIVPFAAKIKEAVSIPVTCAGRIDVEDAERFIGNGSFDFVQIGRKLLADPDLPKKLREGKADEIRLCLNCYYCVSCMYEGKSVECAVNTECCHETEKRIVPAKGKKKVVVVGGGPAGMEAARVAAERGHEVVLLEKGSRLGGTVFFGSVCTQTNYNIVNYLTRQLELLGVDVRLGVKADKGLIEGLSPDSVILATGSKRELPKIPGGKQRHVMDGDTSRDMITGDKIDTDYDPGFVTKFMCTCGRILGMLSTPAKIANNSRIWMPFKKKVVIVGGEIVGLEMAEFLMDRGREIVILEEGDFIGDGLALVRRWKVAHDVIERGTEVKTLARVTNIGKDTITYVDADGHSKTISADNVVVAQGATPNDDLGKSLRGCSFDVCFVGDCNGRLSYIDGAIHEAYDAACAL